MNTMAGHSNGSRRPTTAWSRLKTVTVDPLEDMGLLSKGDSRHANLRISVGNVS